MTTQTAAGDATGEAARRPDWPVVAAVAVTVLAWASAFVAIRWAGQSFSAGPMALGRLAVASAALGAFLLVRRIWVWPRPREWALLALCGLAWFAVYNVALNAAGEILDAGTMAMVVSLGPVLIALLAGLMLGEGFPRWLMIGAGVAFAGAVLIGAGTARVETANVWGVVLCLLAAVMFAVGAITQKPVLRRVSGLQVTWLACTIGAVACLPFLPQLAGELRQAPAGAVGAVVYMGVVATAVAFSTWAFALSRMDAGRLGVQIYLVPPTTVVLGWVLLGEIPVALALLGGVVCLAGVSISRRRPGAR